MTEMPFSQKKLSDRWVVMNFKTPKFRSEKHLKFVRSLPCIVCAGMPCDAAHIRVFTDGGTSLKPSDHYTVPLCRKHHRMQHHIGELSFWDGEDVVRKLIVFAQGLVGADFNESVEKILTYQWRK